MHAHFRSPTVLGLALALIMLTASTQADAGESADPDIFVTNRSSIPIRLHRPNLDLNRVERVQFWQTNDRGDTWLMVRDIAVTDTLRNEGRIGYVFRPARDGYYGFRICVHNKDGSADPEPRSGQRPAAADTILVDTTPPEVVRFSVEALATDNPDPLRMRFQASWAIRDLNPAAQPATIEWSDNGEQWHPLATDLGVHGRHQVNPPTSSRFLRLRALDAAGNETLSKHTPVPWPATPPKSQDESTQAPDSSPPAPATVPSTVSELPASAPESEAPAPEAESREEAPGPKLPSREELLAAAGRTADAVVTQPTERLDAYLPVAPVIPSGHQDIVEPFKNRQQMGPTTHPQPVPAASTTIPTQEGNSPTVVREIPPTSPPQEPSTLNIPDREAVLRMARELSQLGSLSDAQRHYRSLRGSSVSRQALPEEMAILRRLGRAEEALAIYRVAPTHDLSDAAHLMRALVLIDLGRAAESLHAVEAIADHAPHYREARFIRGLALHRLGDSDQARAQMQILSAIKDRWGNLAASWLQRHRGP